MVRLGSSRAERKLFFRLNREKRELERQGFEPEPRLLAERLDVTEHDVVRHGAAARRGRALARRAARRRGEQRQLRRLRRRAGGESAEEQVGTRSCGASSSTKVQRVRGRASTRATAASSTRASWPRSRRRCRSSATSSASRASACASSRRGSWTRLREYLKANVVDFEYYAPPTSERTQPPPATPPTRPRPAPRAGPRRGARPRSGSRAAAHTPPGARRAAAARNGGARAASATGSHSSQSSQSRTRRIAGRPSCSSWRSAAGGGRVAARDTARRPGCRACARRSRRAAGLQRLRLQALASRRVAVYGIPHDAGAVRRRVVISGRVQGVAFRAATRAQARAGALAGWVRNLADGRVEAVFEGDPAAVGALVAWCHRGRAGHASTASRCRTRCPKASETSASDERERMAAAPAAPAARMRPQRARRRRASRPRRGRVSRSACT